VDPWVQRFDPATEDRRAAGVLRHLDHGHAELLERLGRAARRQHLDLVLLEQLRQNVEVGLVADADERATDRLELGVGHAREYRANVQRVKVCDRRGARWREHGATAAGGQEISPPGASCR